MRVFIPRPTAETATVPGLLLLWLFGVSFLLAQVDAYAQETFSRAYTFTGVGGVVEVPGSNGFLLCQTERYGLGDIDGFSFWRLGADGSLDTSYFFSTGPLYNVMQGGAIPMVRSDGSFTFLFGNHAGDPSKLSIRLFNTTSDGVMNWNRKVEFEAPDQMISFRDQTFFEAPDGGYVIVAPRSYIASTNYISPVVIKLDASGNVEWNKSYNVTETCGYRNCCAVDPSGEIFVGFNSHHLCGTAVQDSYITKIAADGGTLWSKRITGLHGGIADCVRQDDGYLIIANDTNAYCFVKVDGSGDLLWSRSYILDYGMFVASQRVDATRTYDDGAVVVSGFSPTPISQPGVDLDVLLFKVDLNGSIVWKNYFNDALDEMSTDVVALGDSSLAQLSRTGGPQYYIRKLSSDGYSPCVWDIGPDMIEAPLDLEVSDIALNEFDTLMLSTSLYVNDTTSWETLHWTSACYVGVGESEAEGRISISPNPFTATAVVDLGREIGNAELLVYDARGVQALQVKLNSRRSIISGTGLADGIYLYRVMSHGVLLGSGKFIVE